MRTAFRLAFGRLSIAVALSLAALALAACGTAAEPQPTIAPPAATSEAATGMPEAPAKLAPTFELPNAAGETVSLASYAGEKNVVLVFYRGFW